MGSSNPEIIILGFSKGNNQNNKLRQIKIEPAVFQTIPFYGMRDRLEQLLNKLKSSQESEYRFHFRRK